MQKTISKSLPPSLLDELPSFINAEYLPQKYADSTHELWRLKNKQDNMFLKVCNNTGSQFWQVMQHLFGLDLHAEINGFMQTYSFIKENTFLEIPKIITAQSIDAEIIKRTSYILSSEVSGDTIEVSNLKMVKQLAQHLTGLHFKKNNKWGTLKTPEFDHLQWQEKLATTLSVFANQQGIPRKYLEQALDACQFATNTTFIPSMPDLRWDQFLQQNGQLYALVDLDAFVLAPRELDFVLLEYILTAEQYSTFIDTYSSTHPVPDISQVRPAYRLLLFLMQVLGEQEIGNWMNKEHRF